MTATLLKCAASATALAIGFCGSSFAMAEDAAEADVIRDEITVTGSRVVRDGEDAPTPTTVIGLEDVQKSAPAYLADYLNQLPELANSLSPTTGRNGSSSGGNFLNLRGLGVNRTLVLLDSRRVAPSILTGGVDISLLPTSLVKRVDIVTGGASAAWGSDAVAGVINIILDKDFTGVKGTAQYGITDEGDGEQYKVNMSLGTSFANERGHVLVSVEHTDVSSIEKASARDWYQGWNIIPNPDAGVMGQPARLVIPGVGVARSAPEGVISTGPLAGTGFDENGAPVPYDLGFTAGLLSFGGDAFLHGGESQIQVPLKTTTVFARTEYEISPVLTVFAEGNFAQTDNDYLVRSYQRFGDITIQNDNAFLHPAMVQAMTDASVTSFNMGKIHLDFGPSNVQNDRRLFRGVVGAEGDLGAGWEWDSYYQYGKTSIDANVVNNVVTARYNEAVDSVLSGGIPVCRSTLSNPGNGCVPVNPFGANAASSDSRDYVVGVASQ
ncbi:MAG: TonB-dependent receptor plug domain-containing protein, partial [Amphiplicatus sp.]